MTIEAKPGTDLRSYALCALADEGLAGPPYNLDDVSARIYIDGDSIHVSFWDMERYIREENRYYKKLKELSQKHV